MQDRLLSWLGPPVARATAAWLAGFSSAETRRAYAADLGLRAARTPSRPGPAQRELRGGVGWLWWCHTRNLHPVVAGAEDVRAWLSDLRPAGYAVATRARGLAALRSWYAHLVEHQLVVASPAAGVSPAAAGLRPGRLTPTIALSASHAAALLSAADGATGPQHARHAAVVAVLFTLGLRVGELTGLATRDLTGAPGARRLRVMGKGEHERHLALPALAEARLEAYLAIRSGATLPARRDAGRARPRSEALFATRTGAAITPYEVFRLLRRLAAQADLPTEIIERLSPHVARHTAASLALAAGQDITAIRDLLGHGALAVTERYLHGAGATAGHAVADTLATALR